MRPAGIPMTFPVLLHPDLYRRLQQSEREVRSRVWKTLSRLREGLWGGGTRVKRLRGMAGRSTRPARTPGDRLLFTVVRSALASQPDRFASHLQIWDLVEHDDAERAARRNRSPEPSSWSSRASSSSRSTSRRPTPRPASTSCLRTAPATAEPLLRFLLPPEGFVSDADEGIIGGVRWYRLDPGLLAGEEDFQRLFDAGGDELELKLTREQYEVLNAPGPVLLAGSAGSGKTTVAAHRLAAAAGIVRIGPLPLLQPGPGGARPPAGATTSCSPEVSATVTPSAIRPTSSPSATSTARSSPAISGSTRRGP